MTCSRLVRTTRPSGTIFISSMASRITPNASAPTLPSGVGQQIVIVEVSSEREFESAFAFMAQQATKSTR